MRTTLIAALVAAAAAAAPAAASTTVGADITGNSTTSCTSGTFAFDTSATELVPAGGGVITSLTSKSALDGKHVSLKVVRPGAGAATVLATTPLMAYSSGVVSQTGLHVPVQAGDAVGIWVGDDNAQCGVNDGGPEPISIGMIGTDPQTGASVPVTSAAGARVAVTGTLEPDADHDGFGDETQDSCPSDAAIHEGSCVVDLGAVLTAVPSKIGVGDVSVLTATISNASTGTGQGITMLTTPSPGLSIVTTSLGSACTFAGALSCPLGSLAGGASQAIIIVVKGNKTGAQNVTVGLTGSSTDPNAANNTASQAITVEKRQAVKCRVPKLSGLTKAFAKTLLKAVNCKLGKVTKKASAKGKSGTVIKQSVKAGKVRPAGTKVNVTLKK
jgi:hypothetical protein